MVYHCQGIKDTIQRYYYSIIGIYLLCVAKGLVHYEISHFSRLGVVNILHTANYLNGIFYLLHGQYFYCCYYLVTWNTYVSLISLSVHSIVVPIGNFHFLIALLIARIVLYFTHIELHPLCITNSSPKSHELVSL